MLTVCNYHYIRESFNSKYPSIFGVTPQGFKNQLQLLNNQGDFISANELLKNKLEILNSNKNYILITFDDGLKEQFELALPILTDLNIPAIFFANSLNFKEKRVSLVHKNHLLRSQISPDVLLKQIVNSFKIQITEEEKHRAEDIYRYDEKTSAILKFILNFKLKFEDQELALKELFFNFFDEDDILSKLYMSENQIKNLARINALGSHTHSHFPIGMLSEDKINFELEYSKNYFEDLTQTIVDMVSYPYGTNEAATSTVAIIAKKVGYQIGFTTNRGINGINNNPLLLNRFDCNDLIGGKNYIL